MIALLAGPSQYGVLHRFLRELADGFVRCGREARIIDLTAEHSSRSLAEAVAGGVDFVFSYNGLAMDARIGEESYWDAAGLHYFTALVDHPYHQIDRLTSPMRNLTVTCVDRRHVRFLQAFLGEEARCYFLPHFGMEGDRTESDRDIDILFPGSFGNADQTREGWRNLSPPLVELAVDVCDEVLGGEVKPLEEAIPTVCGRRGIPVDGDIYSLLPEMDLYIRQRRRETLLTALADAGLVVDVVGSCGAPYPALSRHRLHAATGVDESITLMRRAKIVLNAGPNFCDGSHERVFSAMLNGAVAVTDVNGYWPEQLVDGEEALFYEWQNLSLLPDRLRGLLADVPRREEVAAAGERKAGRYHTPQARAERIIEIADGFRPTR